MAESAKLKQIVLQLVPQSLTVEVSSGENTSDVAVILRASERHVKNNVAIAKATRRSHRRPQAYLWRGGIALVLTVHPIPISLARGLERLRDVRIDTNAILHAVATADMLNRQKRQLVLDAYSKNNACRLIIQRSDQSIAWLDPAVDLHFKRFDLDLLE
jgi:hypothetical protein